MEQVSASSPSFEDGPKPLMTDISLNLEWLGEVGEGKCRYFWLSAASGLHKQPKQQVHSKFANVSWSALISCTQRAQNSERMREYNTVWEIIYKLAAEGHEKPVNNFDLLKVHLTVPVILSPYGSSQETWGHFKRHFRARALILKRGSFTFKWCF